MNKKFSILYVDDEESNLRIFKNTFRREYNIFIAKSAKEGIDILTNNSIDIILSDQRMPEMTGVQFLKYTQKTYPQLHRILITGFTDFSALQNAINDAKIFQYIQKPWHEKDLRNTIEEALRVYKLEQENEKLNSELLDTNENLTKVNLELKETNEELLISKNKAEESDRLKSAFLSNISHEIRTPMNGIIGFSEILMEHEVPEEQRKEYLGIIIKSCKQLTNIIDDIIEVSRLASSKVKVQFEKLDINFFFNSLIERYSNLTNNKVDFIANNEIKDIDREIISDEIKLKKILSNLIDNAVKYTSEGYVQVICRKSDDNIVFVVEDTGIGISDEMKEDIFDYFRQEDEESTKEFGGLGLGLSIVRENTKLLNGEIILKSEKGKGSSFLIRIPCKKETDKIILKKKDEIIESSSSSSSSFTVLITEDEEVNALYLETILKKIIPELKVLKAENGQEAVDICSNNDEIDFIFMDIKMPIMNGFEATERIKKIHNSIPIVAQTAYTTIEDRNKAKLAGCDDFITKPISIETLRETITKYRSKVQ